MGALRILEIEIDNFKTFRHEVIPFLAGFTAISGPNGSGKSNILDALLWCLGLSSNRTLRAEKGTDLINNGSSRREARVTVRLGVDEGTKEQPVAQRSDRAEAALGMHCIEVSRRIRESQPTPGNPVAANSTYYLNGRVASLTEIHDLLALHHISPSGYNVVMQGDVTSIIRMTASERRKIIDEVAGVAEFDHRIDQARKELQAVFEQEERTALLLGELAARLDGLRVERDQALKYLELKEELKRYELAIRLAGRWELLDGVKGLQKVLESSSGARAELEAARLNADVEVREALRAETEISERIRIQGGERLVELERLVKEAWEAAERARLEREAALARALELSESAERDGTTLTRLRAAIAEAQQKVQDLAAERQAREAEAQELEADREVKQKEVDEILATQAEVRERLERLRARHTELYNKRGMLDVERYKLEAQRREAEDRLVRLKEERVGQLAQLKDAEGEAKRQREAAEKARMTVDTAREDEGRCLANVETLRKSLAEVEAALKEAMGQFAIAEQQLKAQEATMGTAVDTVLEAGIPGVIGTLLMLGEAEPEFARALQEAAGPRLRNIVVDNDGVAAKVSKLLHGKSVGRVTCLPLNKLQPARRLNQVRVPGCLGYAIDKVRFDARYEAAFFQAFGDTLLFETLDHARPHIGQYRMVTLDGDVLDKGGAMTIGRSRGEPAHFLANLRTAYEERKAAVQTHAQRVSQRQHALAEMQKGAESAMTRLREAQHAAMAADLEQESALGRAKEAATRLAETDSALDQTEREVKDRDRAVEAAIDAGLPVDAEFNEVEFELAEVEESVGNDRLNELMEQVRNAGWDADQARSRANGLATEIEAAERSSREADLALVTAEAERARKLAEADREKTDAARIETDLTRLQQDRQTLEAEHQKAKSGLEELAALRDTAKDRRYAAERALEARNQDLDRLADGLRHTTEKLEEQTSKLQEMETGLWEDGIEPPEGRPETTTAQAEAARQDAQVRLEALGMVNQLAIEQFEREDARASELREKLDALRGERETIETRIADISGQKRAVFMEAFEQINGYFADIFAELAGGTAKLSLENAADPFDGGLIIHAQPPGSKVFRLEAMSGGEKSLTALAFLFGIQRTQPAPFYALDEVDHALDGVNDERLARMIGRQAEHAQMIVISHRKPMISHSHQAIGVHARPDGSTRVTGIRWGRAERVMSERAVGE